MQIAKALIEPGFFFVGMQMESRADGCSCTAEVLARNQVFGRSWVPKRVLSCRWLINTIAFPIATGVRSVAD
jgi:hypothetical protein